MKNLYFFCVFGFLTFAGLSPLFIINSGCQKTDHPLGVYAPDGLDRPTITPTPSRGSIEIFVLDSETAIQNVPIILIDPTGNTVGPVTTVPVYGYAPFNPTITNGTWTAEVLTGGVSYVIQSSGVTINHYYYQSSQTFPVTGSGNYAVSFINGNNTVNVSPVSMLDLYPTQYDIPLTVTYNQSGNLNVPITIQSPTLPTGWTSIPANFVLGEGITQQGVSIDKSSCYGGSVPYTIAANDFTGYQITSSPATIYRDYPVSVLLTIAYNPLYYIFTPHFTNDCGTTWNYSFVGSSSGTTFASGGVTNGVTVNVYASGIDPDFKFYISSNIGSNSVTFPKPNSGTVTFLNTIL